MFDSNMCVLDFLIFFMWKRFEILEFDCVALGFLFLRKQIAGGGAMALICKKFEFEIAICISQIMKRTSRIGLGFRL